MAPNPINSNEVIGGGNGLMLANTSTGQIVRRVSQKRPHIMTDNQVELPSPVVHLTSQDRGVISASLSGSVSILDPRSGFRAGSSSVVQAHTGGLSGADVQTNLISTWGWTHS
jgi:PAB-dependent poly(A)-specific ribonuclease subunit 2